MKIEQWLCSMFYLRVNFLDRNQLSLYRCGYTLWIIENIIRRKSIIKYRTNGHLLVLIHQYPYCQGKPNYIVVSHWMESIAYVIKSDARNDHWLRRCVAFYGLLMPKIKWAISNVHSNSRASLFNVLGTIYCRRVTYYDHTFVHYEYQRWCAMRIWSDK